MVRLMSFDKHMWYLTTVVIKILNISITLKISLVPLWHSIYSLISNPRQPVICFLFIVLHFPEWHINRILPYVYFWTKFLSPSIVFLIFIHVLDCISSLLLWPSKTQLYECITVYLPVEGFSSPPPRFGDYAESCYNICMQICICAYVFISLGQMPRVWLLDFMVATC